MLGRSDHNYDVAGSSSPSSAAVAPSPASDENETSNTDEELISYSEHFEYTQLISKLLIFNLIIFSLVLAIFFSLRGNPNYIPHTIACTAVCLALVVLFLVLYLFFPLLNRNSFIEQLKTNIAAPVLQRMMYDEHKQEILAGDNRLDKAYEMPYTYLTRLHKKWERLSRKDSLALRAM